MTTAFDTSGYVLRGDPALVGRTIRTHWDDLSPFTQGYIEALFSSGVAPQTMWPCRFQDLAPETLARVIADCERFAQMHPTAVATVGGKGFWTERQADGFPRFPPLTVQLGDDGRVRFA